MKDPKPKLYPDPDNVFERFLAKYPVKNPDNRPASGVQFFVSNYNTQTKETTFAKIPPDPPRSFIRRLFSRIGGWIRRAYPNQSPH